MEMENQSFINLHIFSPIEEISICTCRDMCAYDPNTLFIIPNQTYGCIL